MITRSSTQYPFTDQRRWGLKLSGSFSWAILTLSLSILLSISGCDDGKSSTADRQRLDTGQGDMDPDQLDEGIDQEVVSDMMPNTSDMTPDDSDMTPDDSDMTPDDSDMTPDVSDMMLDMNLEPPPLSQWSR